MGKVMLVLMIELAVLPVAYGFWLDICALPLLEGSLAGRVALLQHAPVAWTLLHWLLGMACLMATAAFLSLVRGTLRTGRAQLLGSRVQCSAGAPCSCCMLAHCLQGVLWGCRILPVLCHTL